MIPATWLLSATRLAAARGDAAMSAHLSQQLGGAEREPPAWLVHEIARRSRLPRPDDPAALLRSGCISKMTTVPTNRTNARAEETVYSKRRQ